MIVAFWVMLIITCFLLGMVVVDVLKMRSQRKAILALIEGLRLTVEYVGTDTLPPIEGWSWYDTLMLYSPETVREIGVRPRTGSNLVTHAQRELDIIGEDEETTQGYLRIIQAFADMGHSGGSASVAIPVLTELLQYHNLAPLSDDPAEWVFHGPEKWDSIQGVWQNIRNGEAFSNDGGVTYYLLSDHTPGKSEKIMHNSIKLEDRNVG